MTLREACILVQKIGRDHGYTIVIVGGAIVRLIGNQTAIKQIDEAKKTILLDKPRDPQIRREEDGKTTIDIDCIAFADAKDPFEEDTKKQYETVLQALKQVCKQYPDFPNISIEPVLYHPHFSKPHTLTQFVSSIESYHTGSFFFRLGNVKVDVQKKSLDPWTLTFTDSSDTLLTFSPTALQKRYAIRGFGTKSKDMDKIFNENAPFAQFAANFRIKTKGMFDSLYEEWDDFALQIATSKQPSMILKRYLWNIYWQTIGTYMAHGTGCVGKILLPLGNTFFAGK